MEAVLQAIFLIILRKRFLHCVVATAGAKLFVIRIDLLHGPKVKMK